MNEDKMEQNTSGTQDFINHRYPLLYRRVIGKFKL